MLINTNEVESNCFSVSLFCPLTLARISTPARGANCRHKAVFDFDTFVKNGIAKCPICRVVIDEVVVDKEIEDVMRTVDESVTVVWIGANAASDSVKKEKRGLRRDLASEIETIVRSGKCD